MKNALHTLVLFLLFSTPVWVSAQYNWEFGGAIGISNYLGDLGASDVPRNSILDLRLEENNLSLSAFTRYRINPRFSAGLFMNYGRISGDDSNSLNLSRRGRNLSFRNDLFELALRADVNLYMNYDVGRRGYYNPDFKLYLFGGVAATYSNPKANYQGTWYALQPLQTEGQFQPYNRILFAIPAGLGFFFTFDRTNRFGFEAQYSFTFNDYLDDVSGTYEYPERLQSDLARSLANRREELLDDALPHPANYFGGEKRGDPNQNDSYMFVRVYYSKVLRGKSGYYKRGQYNFLHRKSRKRRKYRAKF